MEILKGTYEKIPNSIIPWDLAYIDGHQYTGREYKFVNENRENMIVLFLEHVGKYLQGDYPPDLM